LASGSDADVARVLARAFGEADPFWAYVEPDTEALTRALKSWFPICVRYGRVYGVVDSHLDGEVVGGAVWLAPDRHEMTFWRMLRTGMLRTPRILGRSAFGRLNRASKALDAARARLMPPDADYLWILGVDPAHQGRGQGAATIAHGLARADGARKPVYLETYKERNLAFYRRHSFEVVREEHPPHGPPFWAMLRPAQR
jgi:ribosomal protein S18 acetylase RimI-like enzyme